MKRCPFGKKASYHDEEQAKEAIKTMKYKGVKEFKEAKVYRCPKCFMYHITTKGY